MRSVLLWFKDKKLEDTFHREKERQGPVGFACALLVMVFLFAVQLMVLPRWVLASHLGP